MKVSNVTHKKNPPTVHKVIT